jgi:hypothetical protein
VLSHWSVFFKSAKVAGRWWLTPVILVTQEAEIRRITVQSQPGQIVYISFYLEKTHHKKRAGGVAQGVGPELKPQYGKKKKESAKVIRTKMKNILNSRNFWVRESSG